MQARLVVRLVGGVIEVHQVVNYGFPIARPLSTLSDFRYVYDRVEIRPGAEGVVSSDVKEVMATTVGSHNLKMNSKTDLHVYLAGVYVTEGVGFNDFLLYQAQARQITMDKDGVHFCLFDNRRTVPSASIGSLFACDSHAQVLPLSLQSGHPCPFCR